MLYQLWAHRDLFVPETTTCHRLFRLTITNAVSCQLLGNQRQLSSYWVTVVLEQTNGRYFCSSLLYGPSSCTKGKVQLHNTPLLDGGEDKSLARANSSIVGFLMCPRFVPREPHIALIHLSIKFLHPRKFGKACTEYVPILLQLQKHHLLKLS